jgi:hypothetical protein
MYAMQIPTARQTLVDRYGDQVASYAMMKGYLFRHLESANCWCTLTEFEQYNWEGARFAFPEKSEWMTAFQGYTGKTMNTRTSLTYIRAHFAHSTNSLAVVVLSKRGQQNLFIVQDNW